MRFKQIKPQHLQNKEENKASHNHVNIETCVLLTNDDPEWNGYGCVDKDVDLEQQSCHSSDIKIKQKSHEAMDVWPLLELGNNEDCKESSGLLDKHIYDLSAPLVTENGVIIQGRRPIFSELEETKIATRMKQWKEQGVKYTRLDVVKMASEYAVRLGKRPQCRPLTVKWFRSFLTRHPECYLRKSRRTKSEHPEMQYFNQLDMILTANKLKESPHCIFSLVELQLPMLKKGQFSTSKDLSMNRSNKNGIKPHSKLTFVRKAPSSILFCGSAAGQALPPFLLFAGKLMDRSLLSSLTPGAGIMACPSGRTTSEVLISFLRDHFLSQAPGRSGDTLVLLLDATLGRSISQAVVDIGSAFKVVFVTAKAMLNQQLHPMLVGCCDTFQRELCFELQKPLHSSESKPLSSTSICESICRLYHHNMTAENLHATFRNAGIFPFDPSVSQRHFGETVTSIDKGLGHTSEDTSLVSHDLTLHLRTCHGRIDDNPMNDDIYLF